MAKPAEAAHVASRHARRMLLLVDVIQDFECDTAPAAALTWRPAS